jgi:hypothetical protein
MMCEMHLLGWRPETRMKCGYFYKALFMPFGEAYEKMDRLSSP